MKSNNRSNYLFKNTAIFALSMFATKLITFFLVPLYTNTLNPEEYGLIDLLFTISSFLFPLFTLNISEAIYRFSMDRDNDSSKVFSIGLVCFILSVVLSLITIPIFYLIPSYRNYAIYFYIYLTTLSLAQILLITLKGNEKLKLFSVGNVLNTFLIAFFNILFLVVFRMNIIGYFLAYIISNIFVIIYGLITNNVKKNISNFNFDKKLFLEMIKYSIVLLPTSFMWWIINSSDRIMITSLVGVYDNGIYAISYKLPSLLTLIASIFNQAWVFSAIKEQDSNDYEKYTNTIFTNLFAILAISAIGLLGFIKPIFSVYVAPEYYVAWKYVPFLVFGYVFMTLATFISTSYNVKKDSKGFLFSGLSGAVANIVLNFIFIPLYGVYGAAFATMCSYIIVFIYRLIDTRKYVRININIKHISLIGLTLISCITTYFDTYINIACSCIIMGIIVIIYKNNIAEVLKILKNKR